jgi:hypothetical protein
MTIGLKGVTVCIGYQQITSLSSSAALTVPAVDKNGNKIQPVLALIQAEGNDVRWRDDGTAPTSTVGMLLLDGETLAYDGNLVGIRFIQAASAKLNVSYYA